LEAAFLISQGVWKGCALRARRAILFLSCTSGRMLQGNLPISSDGVLSNERIGRQEDTVVFESLAHEHAIKWVSMKGWQFVQMQHRGLFERKRSQAVALSLLYHESIESTGERQFPESVFHREFPD
jgi:hypothetical protein